MRLMLNDDSLAQSHKQRQTNYGSYGRFTRSSPDLTCRAQSCQDGQSRENAWIEAKRGVFRR